MYPLPSGFGFKDVAIGMAAVLKVEMPLPVFPVEAIFEEEASHFLRRCKQTPRGSWVAMGLENMLRM
jgi:hypothetical protein